MPSYNDWERHESELWVPQDAVATVEKGADVAVVIDNQTDLDDRALEVYFEQNTELFGFGEEARFSTYGAGYGGGQGTMMARAKWRPPRNVIDEIRLARDFAERDDDVGATMGTILAAAFSEGYQNQHQDEQVEHTFEKIAEDVGLRHAMNEFHRELLISGQINSVSLFTRETYDIRPENVTRVISRSVAAPLMGVLPAENVRVLGNDIFGTGQLAYVPDGVLEQWLRQFWGDGTTPARKREMRLQDPIAAALFTGKVTVPWNEVDLLSAGMILYTLNPSMVHRSYLPKGSWRYPRPLLTRDFALLEAKRLLNIMDHALLQGGTNFIVVAKKGDKDRPATQPELTNLKEVVKRASRSGVLIGDHRISLEIITPNLTELLNPEKRQMLGRKISQALLRVPEFSSDESGQSVATFTELAQRVITADRSLVVDHIQRYIWAECMKRNAAVFGRSDRPDIWMPKIILQGLQFWTDYLLKLYDRGDLPRKYMVTFGGFNYDSVKAQKQREVEAGHDDIFAPPAVPFSSPANGPGAGPQDNGTGRPPGSRTQAPGATPDRGRPKRLVRRTRGETIKAYWSDDAEQIVRIGEITAKVIEEYQEVATLGRLTAAEHAALDAAVTTHEGNVIVVPVNPGETISEVRAVRLEDGVSLLCGNRHPDGAIMAAAVCFREPRFTLHEAEDMVLRWGYSIYITQADDGAGETDTCPECSQDQPTGGGQCANCGYDGSPFEGHRKKPRLTGGS